MYIVPLSKEQAQYECEQIACHLRNMLSEKERELAGMTDRPLHIQVLRALSYMHDNMDAALAAEAQKDSEIAQLRAEVNNLIEVARSAGCYFYCEACRAAGHVHCSEADRCTGMKLLPPRAKSEATLPPCVNGECLYSCADDECKKATEKGLPWPPVAAEAAPQEQQDEKG